MQQISKLVLRIISRGHDLVISLIVTAVFAVRWGNCLPFSGRMPALNDPDLLAIYGRYLIYAKEPFSFPLGLVHNLGFPFENTNISKASIPLFAVPFKILAKIYEPLSEFYFPVLFEIVSVFLTAYLVCLILREFSVKIFWIKLLGAILICLSPALLFRSSVYYGMPFMVGYFPAYMAMAYFFIKLYRQPGWKYSLLLAIMIPVAALIDYYLLLGELIILGIILGLCALDYFLGVCREKSVRLKFISVSLVAGLTFMLITLWALDDQSNLRVPPGVSALVGRFDTNHGYGGGNGMGGGFHVADVLSLFIPPEDSNWKGCGPASYFTKLGVPIKTAADLQDGQYEGFTYMGTILICIAVLLLLYKLGMLLKNYKMPFQKWFFNLHYKMTINTNLFSLTSILFLASLFLYIMSWGYIIHFAGYRLNNILTPYLFLSDIYPTMMFARSPGRLATPFMLFLGMAAIIVLGRYTNQYVKRYGKTARIAIACTVIFLSLIHIYEVSGYLKQSQVTRGNDIMNTFNMEDKLLIIKILHDYKAVLPVPAFRDNVTWSKICYSITAVSNKPIGGATGATGTATNEQMNQYNIDTNNLISGNIKDVIKQYGKIAIIAPPEIAKKILQRSNFSLKSDSLINTGIVILTPNY